MFMSPQFASHTGHIKKYKEGCQFYSPTTLVEFIDLILLHDAALWRRHAEAFAQPRDITAA